MAATFYAITGYNSVLGYGAVADATDAGTGTDNTAAFQAALTAAGDAGGGVAWVPAGNYRIDGTLSVPACVQLAGVNLGPSSRTGYRDGSPAPKSGGSKLYITGHSGSTALANAPITQTHNSAVVGLSMYWPNQGQSSAPPTSYPPAIVMRGNNPTVRDVELLNPYIGIDINNTDGTNAGLTVRPTVERVTGQPLYRGIICGTANDNAGGSNVGILDIPRFIDVHFNPWWSYPQSGTSIPATLYNWQLANAFAFLFGDADEVMMRGCFAFGYNVGVYLQTPTRGVYGSFVGGDMDTCNYGFLIAGCSTLGFRISGCGIASNTIGIDLTAAGCVLVSDSNFWIANPAVTASAGRISLANCNFGIAGTQVTQSGSGVVRVNGGFANGGLGVTGTVTSANVGTF